jgi:hypothetical protein
MIAETASRQLLGMDGRILVYRVIGGDSIGRSQHKFDCFLTMATLRGRRGFSRALRRLAGPIFHRSFFHRAGRLEWCIGMVGA